MPADIGAFRTFLEGARELLARGIDSTPRLIQHAQQDPSGGLPVERYRVFIERAQPLIVEPARKMLGAIAPRLATLNGVLLDARYDLLEVAGLSYVEDAYTELMRWALDGAIDPQMALACQRAWLAHLEISVARLGAPLSAQTWLATDGGIPDLILRSPECVVIVEAKTGSDEHNTAGGDLPQTIAYPQAVRRQLQLAEEFPLHMVFLTPDRQPAANPDATCTTYLDFALALAGAIQECGDALDERRRWPYALLVTHWIDYALPAECNIRRALELARQLQQGEFNDRLLLAEILNVASIHRLLEK